MELGFLIKKCITFFIEPLGMILSLLLLGLFLWFRKKERLAQYALSLGVTLLFLFSYQPFSNLLVSVLEEKYPKYETSQEVSYIHVLGNGHTTDISQPITSQLSDAGVKRVIEGIRLHLLHPKSKLIFTGYEGDTNTSNAQMNAKLAKALGVKEENMIVNPQPKDTKEEALFAKEIVGEEPFILVTSATHMPRSMKLFSSVGLDMIAAPTGFKKDETDFLSAPSISNLQNSQRAVHEYLGMLWNSLRG
ncbi:MAG: YdcF family protein [Helicobacteraceae bacterium]|nr:YdcF family protein [Helicobacteraceae bacterium]